MIKCILWNFVCVVIIKSWLPIIQNSDKVDGFVVNKKLKHVNRMFSAGGCA